MLADNFEVELGSQLDLIQWFTDIPPPDIAQHQSYADMLGALKVAMDAANIALANAGGRLNTDQFRTLVYALQEFDRCADILDAVITNSLTDVDVLTGLFNRAAFDRDLSREVAKARRSEKSLSIAMIDADKFKSVNDTHGHAFGDVVLRKLAERFMESLRPSDLLYRYGGEEFVVLLPDTSIEQAQTVLDRLRQRACATPISKDNTSVTQFVSVGISALAVDELPDTAIGHADQALFRAKSEGRNRVVLAAKTTAGKV